MPAEQDSAATNLVFKALADETRRFLLDRLHEQNGQTLSELCERLAMTRQSATQHLAVLQEANLVSTVRRGREKLHYLNPVPLAEIDRRWIHKFEHPRLRMLDDLKRQAEQDTGEEMTERPSFVYVSYIASTPEKVWQALTDANLSARWWGHSNVSDWQVGSTWQHQRTDGSGIADVEGTVVETVPGKRLVITWSAPGAQGSPSQVAFDIDAYNDIVRLTTTHTDLSDEDERNAAAAGWSAVLSNLKSLLETGQVLPQSPWEMPAGKR